MLLTWWGTWIGQAFDQSLTGLGRGGGISEDFVDTCLDLMGPLEVSQESRQELVEHATVGGALGWNTEQESSQSGRRVGEMLQLIVSLRDYQHA